MMNNTDFCVFILTNGRPHKVITYDTLRRQGYTGEIYIVIDDEDNKRSEYIDRFEEKNVLMFSKEEVSKTFDEGDNFNDRRAIIYARNACFELAEKIGKTYFIELDDDYIRFIYKFNDKNEYREPNDKALIRSLDSIFDIMLEFYKKTPALSIAMSQQGDFLGGHDNHYLKKIKPLRKCMNSFICSTERKFSFFGRINEDVNTYTALQNRGGLFLTLINVALDQKATQSNSGGMTETYLDFGTYLKSFYSVMYMPSSVKISELGTAHRRIHHKINWSKTAPLIIDEKYKKTKPTNERQSLL